MKIYHLLFNQFNLNLIYYYLKYFILIQVTYNYLLFYFLLKNLNHNHLLIINLFFNHIIHFQILYLNVQFLIYLNLIVLI